MMRVALAFVPLLLLFGILTFDQTFATEPPVVVDRIHCQFRKTEGDPNSYFLVNRRAALHVGRILIGGLLLNDLKNFVDAKTNKNKGFSFFVKEKTRAFSFTSEECLKGIERIRKNYDNKCDLEEIGQIQKKNGNKCDNLPTVGSDINYVIKMFAHAEYGLDWMAAKVRSGVMASCYILKLRFLKANAELKNNVYRLCQLARQIVDEQYDRHRDNFQLTVGSHLIDDKIVGGKFYAKCKMDLKKEDAEECRKMHEKCIRLYLHDVWRYALSFVLIHRGDTPLEACDVNWQLPQYHGDDKMPVTEEVAYLTYWPIKMLKQIGKYSSEDFKGDAMSYYMLNHRPAGFFHVYMKVRSLRHHLALALAHEKKQQEMQKQHAAAVDVHGNQQEIEKLELSQSQGSDDGSNARAFFTLTELTDMQADSIEEAMKEGSKNYAADEKPKDISHKQAAAAVAAV